MKKKLLMLALALGAAAAASGLFTAPKAEAACKQICCPGDPPKCITCCTPTCPTLVCPPRD